VLREQIDQSAVELVHFASESRQVDQCFDVLLHILQNLDRLRA
jgi:hypothetical protein